jgi:hypothetical protein
MAALVVLQVHDVLLIAFRDENASRRDRVPHFFARQIALQENAGPRASLEMRGETGNRIKLLYFRLFVVTKLPVAQQQKQRLLPTLHF